MANLRVNLQSTLSGTFTIERELGGGGMSRVFLANEIRLSRKVVVKVLSPDLAAGISAERFEREIRLAASLQQANIVPLLSVGDTHGLPWYTMPFVEGESVRARLAQSPPIGVTDVVRILGDVARALQYAHDRGIVHRDIKPDNVLLSGGTAVVTDFGIAKALSASRTESGATLTQMGTSIGTPAYMAPEQAAGDPNVDHRADIYAFGCMAYELLAQRPPFHGRMPQRTLAAHMSEVPHPLGELRPDVPRSLVALIMRCLEKDPEARPQRAADVLAALDAASSASGTTSAVSHKPASIGRALLIYAACAVGVAVVAKAATSVIGLPDWVFPGAIVLMALGLPVILFTGYVQSVTRRTLTSTPVGGARPNDTIATLALMARPHVSWKRAASGGVYVFGGFVVLIAGFMILRSLGIGPAGSLFAKGAMKADDVVLVDDFSSPGDSTLGRTIAQGVKADLLQSRAVQVLSDVAVNDVLRRMQRTDDHLTLAVAREVAVRAGAKVIVDGSVAPLGAGFIVTLRLVTADSGRELASDRASVNSPGELIGAVGNMTRRLRGRIGESIA